MPTYLPGPRYLTMHMDGELNTNSMEYEESFWLLISHFKKLCYEMRFLTLMKERHKSILRPTVQKITIFTL